jgi:integrase/recombinase XerC
MRDQIVAFIQNISTRRALRTSSSYSAVLSAFESFLHASRQPWPPTRPDLEAFLGRRTQDERCRAPATYNQELAALRAFAKFATTTFGWPEDPTRGIRFLREPPHDPAVLTAFEVRRLFVVAAGFKDARRAGALAIIAVLSQVGLRVHELVALDVDQIDVASATLVGVHGKGGTVHDMPLNAPTIALLSVWLADRERTAGAGERALFVSSRGTRISIRTVERLLEKLRAAIGTAKHITPHTLRHSCATLALRFGSDLSTVADLLRHSDVNTTRRYLHLVDERRREAVGRLATTIPASVLPPSCEIRGFPGIDAAQRKDLDAQQGLDDNPPLSDSARPLFKPGPTDAAWRSATSGCLRIPSTTMTMAGWLTYGFRAASLPPSEPGPQTAIVNIGMEAGRGKWSIATLQYCF